MTYESNLFTICIIIAIFWGVSVWLAYRLGYHEGFDEAKAQAQKWIDKHIIRRGNNDERKN